MIIGSRRGTSGFSGKKARSIWPGCGFKEGWKLEKVRLSIVLEEKGRTKPRGRRESSNNWLMRQRADWREEAQMSGRVRVLCHEIQGVIPPGLPSACDRKCLGRR